jgi:hypothetical protein
MVIHMVKPIPMKESGLPRITIAHAWAKIGTLYVRKSAFPRGAAFPQLLRVTVETAGP